MTKEIILETKNVILDRLKNPLIFSFIISLIVYNWKSISIFIFLNVSIIQKIEEVSKYADIYTLLIYPIFTSIVYVLGAPYLSVIIGKLLIKQKDMLHDINADEDVNHKINERENLKHRVELEQLEVELRSKINQKETIDSFIKEIEIRDEQIERLNSLISESHDRYQKILEENIKINKTISELEQRVAIKDNRIFIKEYKGGRLFYYEIDKKSYLHPEDFEKLK